MEDGQSVGTVSLDQARYLAEQSELDLVELNGSATPPIVKLLDYNKYRYQQEKTARLNGAKQKSNELKEIRLSFGIDSHDLMIKAKRAKEFLADGSPLRVYIQLRGRENIFPEKARQRLELFRQEIGAEIDQPVSQLGKRVQIILKPKKS